MLLILSRHKMDDAARKWKEGKDVCDWLNSLDNREIDKTNNDMLISVNL